MKTLIMIGVAVVAVAFVMVGVSYADWYDDIAKDHANKMSKILAGERAVKTTVKDKALKPEDIQGPEDKKDATYGTYTIRRAGKICCYISLLICDYVEKGDKLYIKDTLGGQDWTLVKGYKNIDSYLSSIYEEWETDQANQKAGGGGDGGSTLSITLNGKNFTGERKKDKDSSRFVLLGGWAGSSYVDVSTAEDKKNSITRYTLVSTPGMGGIEQWFTISVAKGVKTVIVDGAVVPIKTQTNKTFDDPISKTQNSEIAQLHNVNAQVQANAKDKRFTGQMARPDNGLVELQKQQ